MKSSIKLALATILLALCLPSCGGPSDETSKLGPHAGKEMALNRPWVVQGAGGQNPRLSVGSAEEEDADAGKVVTTGSLKTIPAGTPFKITKLSSKTNMGAGRTFYYLTIQILEGDYAGKEFGSISASALFDKVQSDQFYGKPSKWPLKTEIFEKP